MAHEFTILFLDIVQYSKRLNKDQRALVLELTQAFRDSFVGQLLGDPRKGYFLATGDGLAVALNDEALHEHPQQVVDFAVKMREDMSQRAQLRIGIHRGPGYAYSDFNARFIQQGLRPDNHNNLAGSAINFAQRVMSLGDPGDILATESFYQHYVQTAGAPARFADVGEVQVKHGVLLNVYKYTGGAQTVTIPKKIQDYVTAKREIMHALADIHSQVLYMTFGPARRTLKARVTLLLFDKASQELFVTNFRFGEGIEFYGPPCELRFSLTEGPGVAFASAQKGIRKAWYCELPPPPPGGDADEYFSEVERALKIDVSKARTFHRPSQCYLYVPVWFGSDERNPFGIVSIDAMHPIFDDPKRNKQLQGAKKREWLTERVARFAMRIQEERRHLSNAWMSLSHF